jgi:UDP-glucuronate 4-epimerase
MRYFITGTAGFIGFHLARRLLDDGHCVTGFDAMTDYYDVRLKEARNAILGQYTSFSDHVGRLEDMKALRAAAEAADPEVIVHLAAQAGVRYSIDHPRSYAESNLMGAFNLLEIAREFQPRHLLCASTSSAYGARADTPFRETDPSDNPLTLYAATKKALEAMSHAYAHLFDVPTTCCRFFTVYGPWGRPDMALFKFVSAIEAGKPIDVYASGEMKRDFTYVDDIVEAVVRLVECRPVGGAKASGAPDSLSPVAPWRLVNIGGGRPIALLSFIEAIEQKVGRKAIINNLPMQPGDVAATCADALLLRSLTGYTPQTSVADGVGAFVDWFRAWQHMGHDESARSSGWPQPSVHPRTLAAAAPP